LPKTSRTWTGARTPSGLKRVRQAEARREVLQPRRSAAKTLVAKALRLSTQPTNGTNGADANATLLEALSALDRAAKSRAIHPNQAARRKSRLVRHLNAAMGGAAGQTAGHVVKTTSKAQAAKAARARIAASKADKAKGAQTAAGKARAALTRSTRTEGKAEPTTAAAASTTTSRSATKATTGSTRAKASTGSSRAKASSTESKSKPKSTRTTSKKTTTR
jgi:ribosomal protein S20